MERVRFIGRIVIPIDLADREAIDPFYEQSGFVLLFYCEIGMEAESDRHYLIAAVLHRQCIGKCALAGSDARRKGELIGIRGAGRIAASELDANAIRLLFDNRPG